MAEKFARALAVISIAVVLSGCTPDARGTAEERLANSVKIAVEAMGTVLEGAPDGVDPIAEDYTTVATHELLSGFEELPNGGAADSTYCLERDGTRITVCVFFPMNVSIPSGLSGFSASVYGCAKLSGVPGSRDITVVDTECPQELIDWLSERTNEDPDAVSISSVAKN